MVGHLRSSSFVDEAAAGRRRRRDVDNMNNNSLCDGILLNILARLPARILYHRMRYVCKQWFHLISGDPSFAHLHLSLSQQSSARSSLVFVCRRFRPDRPSSEEHHTYHIMTADNDLQVQYHVAAAYSEILLGSCNGLLLLLRMIDLTRCAVSILNPVTGRRSSLPLVPSHINKACSCMGGIAFNPATKEYKVVVFFHTFDFDSEKTWCCYIHTLGGTTGGGGGGGGGWRCIQDLSTPLLPSSMMFDDKYGLWLYRQQLQLLGEHYIPVLDVVPSILVNSSRLNWLVTKQLLHTSWHLLSLDVTARDDEKFQRVELNQEMKAGYRLNLMDMRGGLAVAMKNRDNDLVIWALDRDELYSENKIWTKQLVILVDELKSGGGALFDFNVPLPIRIHRLITSGGGGGGGEEEVITFTTSTAAGTSYFTYFTRDLKQGPVSRLTDFLLPPAGGHDQLKFRLSYNNVHVHVDSLVSW